MDLPSESILDEITKAELATGVMGPHAEFDLTLPQGFLQETAADGTNGDLELTSLRYNSIRRGTVWSYENSLLGEPCAITAEAFEILKESGYAD